MERSAHNGEVAGSNPAGRTAGVAKLVYALVLETSPFGVGGSSPSIGKGAWLSGRAPACRAGGRGFDPRCARMIRKTSYFVTIPTNIKAYLSEKEPVLLVMGPLGRAAISFGAARFPRIEKGRLH